MAGAAPPFIRGGRDFSTNPRAPTPTRGRGRGSKNKHWPPTSGSDNERWERGGHRGGRGRGRGRGNAATTFAQEKSRHPVDSQTDQDPGNETEGEEQEAEDELPLDATQEEMNNFWREVRNPQSPGLQVVLSIHSLHSLSRRVKQRSSAPSPKALWMIPSSQNF